MEYVYAAVLLHKAGKDITEDSVKKVLTAAGVAVDDAKVKSLVVALDGVNIEEAIKSAVAAPVAAVAPAASSDKSAEAKKENKEEEKKEESNAAAGLGALFG